MKRIGWMLAAALLAATFAVPARAETATITDMAGRAVRVPNEAGRVVCLGPGALRLIVYLQAADRVVGVENMEKLRPAGRPYWIATPALHRLPVCGPGGPAAINKKPDLEAVLRIAPDLIFVTYMDASLADEIQRTLDIPVVVLSYGELGTFDEAVFEALRIAGRLLGRQERAEAVVAFVESLRRDLEGRTGDIPAADRPEVFVGGIGYRGARGIESTEQNYFPLDWVHATNVAGWVEATVGSHVFLDKEGLLRLDPPTIFVDGGGLKLVATDFAKKPAFYRALRAFAGGRVYTLFPFNYYTTNIGTAAADAYAIGKILFPERFADVDAADKADEIYTFLVGAPVYARMAVDFGPLGGVPAFVRER